MAQTGIPFELVIKDSLEAEIRRGDLGLVPRLTKIFHHKAYYSRDRNSEIVTDFSGELFRKDATDPFLVWGWECKDYSYKVPVDDVEEYHPKLEQINCPDFRNYNYGLSNCGPSPQFGF